MLPKKENRSIARKQKGWQERAASAAASAPKGTAKRKITMTTKNKKGTTSQKKIRKTPRAAATPPTSSPAATASSAADSADSTALAPASAKIHAQAKIQGTPTTAKIPTAKAPTAKTPSAAATPAPWKMCVEQLKQNTIKKVERRPRRSRRPGSKNPGNRGKGKITPNRHVTISSLSRDKNSNMAGKYMYTNWDGNDAINSVKGVSMKEFTIVDSTENKSIQAFDASNSNICLFGKLSRRLCAEHTIQKKGRGLLLLRQFGTDAMACKPDVLRGAKCGGVNTGYKIFGRIGTDAFNPTTNEEKKKKMGAMADQIVNTLEKAAFTISKQLFYEQHSATALSVGRDYHSKCHIDNDYYYTVLTVAAPHRDEDNTVIYYICFPEYSVKIPLMSGDVLMFNPQILHSCSNPRLPGCFMMSAHVSAKTIHSSA